MDSCAQFLAVAEHRLIPSRASLVGHQLRRAGHHSIWAPACQDTIAGGHAGVGVVSLGGAPLSLPSFVTPQFQEFFRLGRVLRTTLPTGLVGRVVLVHEGTSLLAVPMLLLLLICHVTDRWFTPHFSVVARFRIGAWMADVACPIACQPIWPACWLDTPDGSSSSSASAVQDRDVLGTVPEEVVVALRGAVSGTSVDVFLVNLESKC